MNTYSLIEDNIGALTTSDFANRKERDRQIRKSDILKAAEHIFALKGYHQATMQDIAKYAQYATGTVYLYFKDKDELYFSLFEEKMKYLLFALKEKTGHIENARKKLDAFIQIQLGFFEKNQDFFRIFVSERSTPHSVKNSRHSKSPVAREFREFLNQIIKVAQEQNVIRDDYQAKEIAEIFFTIFTSVIFGWLKEDPAKTKDLKKLSDFILDMFLSGAGK